MKIGIIIDRWNVSLSRVRNFRSQKSLFLKSFSWKTITFNHLVATCPLVKLSQIKQLISEFHYKTLFFVDKVHLHKKNRYMFFTQLCHVKNGLFLLQQFLEQ